MNLHLYNTMVKDPISGEMIPLAVLGGGSDEAVQAWLDEHPEALSQAVITDYDSLKSQVNSLVVDQTTNLSGWQIETTTAEKTVYVGATHADYTFVIPLNTTILDVFYKFPSSMEVRSGIVTEETEDQLAKTVYCGITFEDPLIDTDDMTITLVFAYSDSVSITELTDIRVGAGGETYSTAGDAVRGQYSELKNAINEHTANFSGILFDETDDQVPLDSVGYPVGTSGSQSIGTRTQSDSTMPFHKSRPLYTTWHPVSNLSGTFRYVIMPPPTSVAGKQFQIGFWVYNDLTASKSFKFAILPRRLDFSEIYQASAHVGYTQTVDNTTLIIDAEYNGWLHFLVTVGDNDGVGNTTSILLGSAHCLSTDTIKFALPVITLGNTQKWFINYPNPTYNPDFLIDDTTTSTTKTWSSQKINSLIQENPLTGKKVNWIGDSLFYGGGTNGNNGWIGRIADAYGVTFESKAVNGALIIDPNTSGYYSIANNCTSFTETNPDFVIFDGGTNDGFNRTLSPLGDFVSNRYDQPTDKTTSFSSAFEYVIWSIITAYPNAKIGYVVPYKQISYNQSIDVYDITGTSYFNRAIEICEKWGVPYLDLRKKTPLNYQIPALQDKFTDMVHINSDGYDATYNIIAEWMKTL